MTTAETPVVTPSDDLQRIGSGTGMMNSDFLVNHFLDGGGGDPLKKNQKASVKKKGALSGVFVPTCENMWGVLIFLRFFYIIGQAGVLHTLIVVLLSFAVALCTTASMSSIASSGGVASGGGPYYMISRALGPVLGASVGIMYWLAITMLAVLECIGAVESLLMAVPQLEFPFHMQALSSAFMAALAFMVWGGINIVTKLGIVFAFVVFYTLFSFYFGLITVSPMEGPVDSGITGLSLDTLRDNWGPHYDSTNGFGTALALFYPCFTGILSGADRADVLKDPPRSIKRGTFAAICFSFVMYVSLFLLWGSVAKYEYLQDQEQAAHIVSTIVWNPFPNSAFIGIMIASISQCLQCMIVAPRLLQQIAQDDVLRGMSFLKPLSNSGEPVRALLFTYVLAAALVLIGKLDLVAPLLSMCFLVAYGFMNVSCFVLTLLKSPAWRPEWIGQRRWRTWYMFVAGTGSILCVATMVLINAIWALAAVVIAVALYIWISVKLTARAWGSAVDGVRYRFTVKSLLQLQSRQLECVNWRPQVLILYKINMSDELRGIKHHEILNFSAQLRKSRGFCIVACVLESERRDASAMKRAAEEKAVIQAIMDEEAIEGFAEVVVAPTWRDGSTYIIQLAGIGGLVPNTVLLDWPESLTTDPVSDSVKKDFMEVVQTSLAANKAVLAVKGLHSFPSEIVHGTIDIWWMIHDGGFLILLSWLLAQHRTWRSCHLRVFTVAENVSEEQAKGAAELLSRTLRERRLCDVDVEVILLDDALIEPFTYDWTLRVEERHRFLQQLAPDSRTMEPIPLEIDDLFVAHVETEHPTCPSQAGDGVANPARAEFDDRHEVKVSDCRTEAKPSRRFGEHVTCSSTAAGSDEVVQGLCGGSLRGVPCADPEATELASFALAEQELLRQVASPFQSNELCQRLGQIILDRSKRAQLVVMNLPDVWGNDEQDLLNYVQYCDTLTQGLERVLFVHSTGKEIFDLAG